MKKFLAMLMAIMMLLSMTAAFAEDAAALTAEGKFTKKFVGALPLGEVLQFDTTFVVEQISGSEVAPAEPLVTVDKLTIDTKDDFTFDVKYTVKQPAEYGSYIYMITEKSGETENVTYDDGAIFIMVNYLLEDGVPTLKSMLCSDPDQGSTLSEDTNNDKKNDQFVNEYATDSFTLSKKVKGNAASTEDKFVVKVTFTSEVALDAVVYYTSSKDAQGAAAKTIDIDVIGTEDNKSYETNVIIGADETLTFTNVPVGMTVEIDETAQDGKGGMNGYRDEYDTDKIEIDGVDGAQAMNITNTKDIEIPTGVYVDYIPYVVLLAVAVLGLVAFVVKRRMAANNDD